MHLYLYTRERSLIDSVCWLELACLYVCFTFGKKIYNDGKEEEKKKLAQIEEMDALGVMFQLKKREGEEDMELYIKFFLFFFQIYTFLKTRPLFFYGGLFT